MMAKECPHGVEEVMADDEEFAKVKKNECPQCEGVRARPVVLEGIRFNHCTCCGFYWRVRGRMIMFAMKVANP